MTKKELHNCIFCALPILEKTDEVPIPWIYEDGKNGVVYAHMKCVGEHYVKKVV